MRCSCGKWIQLPSHKVIQVDSLRKEYECPSCSFKNIVLRYGKCLEINGEVHHINKEYVAPFKLHLYNPA